MIWRRFPGRSSSGTTNTWYQHKIDGYRSLFEDPSGRLRVFSHNGLAVRIGLRLYADDANQAPEGYRVYWSDRPESLLKPFADD